MTAGTLLVTDAPHPRSRRWALFMTTPRGRVGAIIVVVVVLAGLLAPLVAPYDPAAQQPGMDLLPGGGRHLLGTDEYGRDLLSRLLYGIRLDVLIVVISVPTAAVTGGLLGLVASSSRLAGPIVQRVFDVVLAFPGIVLGAVVAALLGPGTTTLIVVIAITNVPVFGRLTRTAVLTERSRDYVTAARVVGLTRRATLLRHVLPNAVDSLVVQFALSCASGVFIEGGLSFLGFGVQGAQASLGAMLQSGEQFLSTAPLYALSPVIVIALLVLGLNLLADACNDILREG